MTALCGGNPSQPNATSPLSVVLAGKDLVDLVKSAFALSDAWASLIVFAAQYIIDNSTFCTTDPPQLTWPSLTDIQYIVTHPWNVDQPEFAAINSVILNAAWWNFCECINATKPPIGNEPVYPTGAPQLNPPGVSNSLVGACADYRFRDPNAWSLGTNVVWPKAGDPNGAPLGPGPTTVVMSGKVTYPNGPTGTEVTNYTVQSSNNGVNFTARGGIGFSSTVPPTGGHSTIPNGETSWRITQDGSGGNGTFADLDVTVYCGGTIPNTPVAPCCPPDESLLGLLLQIQLQLKELQESIPAPINSYQISGLWAGLHDKGTITLQSAAVALKVSITTDLAYLGEVESDPTFLFKRGFLVPVVNNAPIAGESQLVYNPQMMLLPHLTEQVGYSLPPGLVISIQELMPGP